MDLQQYVRALQKFWWVVLAGFVLGSAYGVYSASNIEPSYRASVTFFVVANSAEVTASAAVQGDQFAQRRVNSYVALLSTDRLAQIIADRPEVEATAAQVQGMIGASGDLDTVLLTATVTSDSEQLAGEVGAAVAVDFVELVDEIENSGDGNATVQLEVVSGPSVSEISPRRMLVVGIPAFWGLLLGLGAAVLLELRDHTVRSEDQLLAISSVPVLGRTPEDRRISRTPLLMVEDPMSVFAESIRQLRTNLQFLGIESPMQVLMMTSSVTEEGKSVTSANLALSLAGAGYRTVVVDADLRRPTLAGHFGLDRTSGLTDVLIGRTTLSGALKPWGPDVTVLSSGSLPPNPTELLAGRNMQELVAELRDRFDVIVLDTPPLLPVADAQVVSSLADGVLLAVRAGRTSRQQVARSVRALESVSAPFLGTVLTMAGGGRRDGYTSYEQRGTQLAPSSPEQRTAVAPRGSPVPEPETEPVPVVADDPPEDRDAEPGVESPPARDEMPSAPPETPPTPDEAATEPLPTPPPPPPDEEPTGPPTTSPTRDEAPERPPAASSPWTSWGPR